MSKLTVKHSPPARTVTVKVPGAGKHFATHPVCSTGRILADVDKRGRVLSLEILNIDTIKVKQ